MGDARHPVRIPAEALISPILHAAFARMLDTPNSWGNYNFASSKKIRAILEGKEPTFIVWAVKDPDDVNLDRIQIIRGWTKSTQIFEKIYYVAWSGKRKPDPATGKVPAVGNTVDVKNATYTNSIGDVELKTAWRDP
jgi:hypothetical protein